MDFSKLSLNGQEYNVKDSKARIYPNVATMKTISNLVNGDIIKTAGYYLAGDGGSGVYLIRNKQESDVEDGGLIHFLQNELVAELISNEIINVKQFGVYGDGTTDDSTIIKSILENLNSGDVVYFPKGEYICETDIIISTNNIRIYGDGRDISVINFNNNGSLTFNGNKVKIEDMGFNKQNKIEFTKYHCTLKSCSINYGNIGLIMKNGYLNQILNCYIDFNKIGVVFEQESYQSIINDSVIDNNEIGVLIVGLSTGVRITNTSIEGNRNKTTNQGCGLAISSMNCDVHLNNIWFEANGETQDSCDVINIGKNNDEEVSSIVTYVDSLYTFNHYDTSGTLSIENSKFTFTKYGVITNGYQSKTIVNNCTFSGNLNKNNKPILYYSKYMSEGLIANNNSVVNTSNSAITTEMMNGVKSSYIFTNLEINKTHYNKFIEGLVMMNSKPLFVYEESIANLSNVKYLHQYQNNSTKYDSGVLLGKKTNSYREKTGTIFINDNESVQDGTDIFDNTESITDFILIATQGSTVQCRDENNTPRDIKPIYDGLFYINRIKLLNKRAYGMAANSVIFALIQLSDDEKKKAKQCIAFKPKSFTYTQLL